MIFRTCKSRTKVFDMGIVSINPNIYSSVPLHRLQVPKLFLSCQLPLSLVAWAADDTGVCIE